MAVTYALKSNSLSNLEALAATPTKSSLEVARKELTQLANAGQNKVESRLGLNYSGLIVLEIIKFALVGPGLFPLRILHEFA